MRYLNLIVTIILIFGISNPFTNDVQKIYNQLENISILSEKVAIVNDFSFSRDVANFLNDNEK